MHWIQWVTRAEQQGTSEKVSQLKYIFRYNVITANTKFIIEQAAALKEEELIEEEGFESEWPGYEFVMGDDQFTNRCDEQGSTHKVICSLDFSYKLLS